MIDGWTDGGPISRPLTHPSASKAISPSSSLPGCNQHRQHIYQSGKGGDIGLAGSPLWWYGLVHRDGGAEREHPGGNQSWPTTSHTLSILSWEPPRTLHQSSLWTIPPPSSRRQLVRKKERNQKKKSNLHGETMIQHLIGLSVPLAGSGGEDGSAFKVVIQSWSVWMQVERRRWTNRTLRFFFRRTSDCADRIEKSRT